MATQKKKVADADKKATGAQLERRIRNAIVFVPKDSNTVTMYFKDRGLTLTATNDYVVIATGAHKHVFNAMSVGQGFSRPYLYTRRVIEMAKDVYGETTNECTFGGFINELKKKEDQSEYSIAMYYSWYLFNIFAPLYSIGETVAESFIVYEEYVHNVSKQTAILEEKANGMTNKEFTKAITDRMIEIFGELEESVLFPAKTDEDYIKEALEPLSDDELNELN